MFEGMYLVCEREREVLNVGMVGERLSCRVCK